MTEAKIEAEKINKECKTNEKWNINGIKNTAALLSKFAWW